VSAWDESGKVGVGAMTVSYSPPLNPPPEGSVQIDWGATQVEISSVTLILAASDGVTQVCVSNDAASCTSWEAYVTEKTWTLLPGEGMRTVYVWFRDGAGNANVSPYSDSVTVYFDPGGGSI
jgi:hypothetical protein